MRIQVVEYTLPKRQRRVNLPSNRERDTNVVPGKGEGEAEAEAEDARPNSLPQTPRHRHAPHVVLTTQVSRALSRQERPRQPEPNPTTPERARQTVRTQQPQADVNKIPSAPPPQPDSPKPDSHISASPQPGGQLQLSDNNPESLTALLTSSIHKTVQESTKTLKDYIKRASASVKKHQEQLNEELDEAAKMAEDGFRTLTESEEGEVSSRVKMAEALAAAAAAREFSLIQEKKVQDLEIEQLNRKYDELTREHTLLVAEYRRLGALPKRGE